MGRKRLAKSESDDKNAGPQSSQPSAGPTGKGGRRKQADKQPAVKCWNCGRTGHTKFECSHPVVKSNPAKKGVRRSGTRGARKPQQAAASGSEAHPWDCSPDVPYMDACCFLHHPVSCTHKDRGPAPASLGSHLESLVAPPEYRGCICAFAEAECYLPECGSKLYCCWEGLKMDSDPSVLPAFGLLPTHTHLWGAELERRIVDVLEKHGERVAALGPIGLNYTPDDADCDAQQAALSALLAIAVARRLPIILHSCDADKDMLRLLGGSVPRSHPLLLGRFSGSEHAYAALLEHFSALKVAVDGRVTFTKSKELRMQVFDTPLDRIVLQSSGPEYVPAALAAGGQECSVPWQIPCLAYHVAEVKELPFGDVLAATQANLAEVFGGAAERALHQAAVRGDVKSSDSPDDGASGAECDIE